MFTTRSLLIVGVLCISRAISEKVVCDLEDSNCLKESAGYAFVKLISGIPGVEPSDPLHQDLIEANQPNLTLKYTNANLSGMKKCTVEFIKLSPKDLKYEYHLGCPHLTIDAEYETQGQLGPHYVEGKGACKVDMYGYLLKFHGDFVNNEGKDGKPHFHLKTHALDIDVKDKVHYEFKNLFNGDKEKSDALHKFANENWETVDKMSRQIPMDAFMNKYIDNVNAYMAIVSAHELLSYEK